MSQHKQVGIVTGASSGIGKQLALQLSQKGYKVIMACRNQTKAETVASDIRQSHPDADLDIIILNLGSLSSVREFAKQVLAKYPKINVLLNNGAETRLDAHRGTEDGFEIHFGTNYLGHFLLTQLLLERLRESAPAHVVNVTSEAYQLADIDSDIKKNFTPFVAYGRSKLANILSSVEIGRRVDGTGLKVISVHPGGVDTEGFQNFYDGYTENWFADWIMLPLIRSLRPIYIITPQKSAESILQLLETDETKNGAYYVIGRKGTTLTKINIKGGERLWESTLATLGLTENDFSTPDN